MDRPVRVAVVDDNTDIRVLVALHLTLDERFELAAQARNGREALALLERDDLDALDAVVLDLTLPDASGLHVLRAYRAAAPDVRVVAFSADTQLLMQAGRDGAAATVTKGENLDPLLAALLRQPIVV